MTCRPIIAPAVSLALSLAVSLAACGEESTEPAPGPVEIVAAVEAEAAERAAVEPPVAEGPEEACAQAIVVAWQGAVAAGDDITRTEPEARARAEALRARLAAGEDFAELARAESDAASSGPRGGLLGTYVRDDFPAAHAAIREAVFELAVNQTGPVLRAPYGWVVARRCAVEKVHTRHILVRYRGARNAGEEITRTQEQARARAAELRTGLTSQTFEATAREHSEDASAETGGDLGPVGRGLLQPAYEEAAWSLAPHAISPVVETAFGYHIIERLPDAP